MLHEQQTMLRIHTELLSYLIGHNLREISSAIQYDDGGSSLTVSAPTATPPKDIDEFRRALAAGRQHGIDDYQETLIGVHRQRDDFFLLGMSIDKATVTWADGVLTIEVYRKNLYTS
jgi:hypothetical protein